MNVIYTTFYNYVAVLAYIAYNFIAFYDVYYCYVIMLFYCKNILFGDIGLFFIPLVFIISKSVECWIYFIYA